MRGYPCGELAIATVDQLWGVDRRASLNPSTGARAWYGYVTTQRVPGTARQLLNDAGHVTASANYDPYGSPEGAALPAPFGYTGELTDPATGSQYLRARWYRPGQGSLLGVDPLLDATGQPYSYATDNPANGADPSGQAPGPNNSTGASVSERVLMQVAFRVLYTGPYSPPQCSWGLTHAEMGILGEASSATMPNTPAGASRGPVLELPGANTPPSNQAVSIGLTGGGITNYNRGCFDQGNYNMLLVPVGWTGSACDPTTDLSAAQSVVVVVFGDLIGGHHSMIFTAGGDGSDWRSWDAVCRPGNCNGTTTFGKLWYQSSPQSAANLEDAEPGLNQDISNDDHAFYYKVDRPVAAVDSTIRGLGRRMNALNLDYKILQRNCHSFTYVALKLLGLQPPAESGYGDVVYGQGWDDKALKGAE